MALRLHIADIGGLSPDVTARTHFLDLFRHDSVGQHHAEPDPARADAILFVDLHQRPSDPLIRGLREHPLARRFPNKVFVYDERDYPNYSAPGIYVGAPKRWASSLPVLGGPYATLHNVIHDCSCAPDLLYSFRGAITHPIRREIVSLTYPRAFVESTGSGSFIGTSHRPAHADVARRRYRDLICRSKFVLCPRGHGPSSLRLYEALTAGRVPVVVSDDWLPPPGIPWSECSVRVPEAQVTNIPNVLTGLETSWPELSASARTASEQLDQRHLWHHYASSIEDLLGRSRPTRALPAYDRQARVWLRAAKARAIARFCD